MARLIRALGVSCRKSNDFKNRANMKLSRNFLLFLLIFLLVPSFSSAQTSRSVTSAANKSWPTFFAKFRTAVIKRDRDALRPMISASFDWTAGELGMSPDHILSNLDTDGKWRKGKPDMWKVLQRALLISRFSGTTYGDRPARSKFEGRNGLTDPYCMFVFESDGRWRWQSFLGD